MDDELEFESILAAILTLVGARRNKLRHPPRQAPAERAEERRPLLEVRGLLARVDDGARRCRWAAGRTSLLIVGSNVEIGMSRTPHRPKEIMIIPVVKFQEIN